MFSYGTKTKEDMTNLLYSSNYTKTKLSKRARSDYLFFAFLRLRNVVI
jgi:hypothetical protein